MDLALDFELSKEDNLLKRFEEIHNYIYANDGLSTQQTLEEVIKILFIKIYDENNKTKQFQISADELNHLKNSNAVNIFVKRIAGLLEETKRNYKDVFDSDEKIRLSNNSLGFTVNKLQSISLADSSNDAKGLAFQKFLAHQEKDGRGQFFTPEPVIDFCVDIIQPKTNETIVDPACGSGGFLISSLKYLLRNNPKAKSENLVCKNLFGLDINKSIARIAKMKLLLEANGQANIFCTNSLEDIDEIKLTISDAINKKTFDGFDIVLTNPPFGTLGKITNTKTLSQYDLGYKWTGSGNQFYKTKNLSNGQSAEILFIERCLQLLKEGGRLGIVLPNGHFENPSLEYLRFYLKQKANVLAIVKLPQETFIPYGTGVKTSLLFLEKETANTKTKYQIFFSKIDKPGYQGNKNGTPIYKKDKYGMTAKEKGVPVLDEDFSLVVEDYKKFQEHNKIKSDNSFSIDFNELNGRFDYDFYSPDNRKLLTTLKKGHGVRLCEVVEIVNAKSKKLNQSDKKVEYIELSDINTHSFEIINTTEYLVHELPSRASYDLQTGDIVTAVAGNSVGTSKHATALVTEENNGTICTNGFRVLRNFKNIDPYYLLYFLKSESFLKQMYMYRTGAAIPNVSDFDLSNILITLPDEKKMKEISNKMRKAFELRQESRKQIDSISYEFA